MRAKERIAAVDVIKALAILAVVVRHAGPPPWNPAFAEFDRVFRASWVYFHVPSFLVVAGFLYARERLTWSEVAARLPSTTRPTSVYDF